MYLCPCPGVCTGRALFFYNGMITDFITWTASPALYDGFIQIRWYGLFFAIGFIVGYSMMDRMFRHEQLNVKWLDSLFVYVVVAMVIGARLGHWPLL